MGGKCEKNIMMMVIEKILRLSRIIMGEGRGKRKEVVYAKMRVKSEGFRGRLKEKDIERDGVLHTD